MIQSFSLESFQAIRYGDCNGRMAQCMLKGVFDQQYYNS